LLDYYREEEGNEREGEKKGKENERGGTAGNTSDKKEKERILVKWKGKGDELHSYPRLLNY
jgi:hypothetical protein